MEVLSRALTPILTPEVYAFGLGAHGQLGLSATTDEGVTAVKTPTRVRHLEGVHVTQVSAGDRHTAVLSRSGSVFTFGEASQTAREERFSLPGIVSSLDAVQICRVACGANHTVVVSDRGEAFAWGKNDRGQIGQPEDIEQSFKPRAIRGLHGKPVSFVSCGLQHATALTRTGEVLAWGDGSYGQLACSERKSHVPVVVEALLGLPITKVACGGNHSFAVSASGNCYAWGANKEGQLGVGDDVDRFGVVANAFLRGKKIVHVACGLAHTAALGAAGTLYTFGCGSSFQLGHGAKTNELQPRPVESLQGMNVIAVECGRQFTVAVRLREGGSMVTCVWGLNSFGQLGTGDTEPRLAPFVNQELCGKIAIGIACGGEHTLFVAETVPDMLKEISSMPLYTLDLPAIERLLTTPADLERAIDQTFSSPSCLNASFLDQTTYFITGPSHSGLSLEQVRAAYTKLVGVGQASITNTLLTAAVRATSKLQATPPSQHEGLRAVLILLLNPLLSNPTKQTLPVMDRLMTTISSLGTKMRGAMVVWLSRFPVDAFIQILEMAERFLVFLLSVSLDVTDVLRVLHILYDANEEGSLVNYTKFYNPDISRVLVVNLSNEYSLWRSPGGVPSILRFPFVMDTVAKSAVFEYDSHMQQHISAFGMLGQVMMFHIRREFLIEDALNAVAQIKHPSLLKCPMKVMFIGEGAIDEGGVRKEFFQLCMRQIFEPDFGLFTYSKETDTFWFEHRTLECSAQYHLFGILVGLAIFNRIQLDIRFPLLVYRLMLGQTPTLADFKRTWPSVGNNIQKLLDYEGDVEADLGLNFSVSYDFFGETRVVDLVPDGRNIAVTLLNRTSYVERLVAWTCTESVSKQFHEFARGFSDVTHGPALALFRAEELENLICGEVSADIDLSQLQAVTLYDGGYNPEHQTIKNFWEVVVPLPVELKRKLLFFSTGSDRIPVGGLRTMRFIIQRAGPDSDRLPSASTCFNVLLLPDYGTKEKLKDRLLTAIQNCEGFGLK